MTLYRIVEEAITGLFEIRQFKDKESSDFIIISKFLSENEAKISLERIKKGDIIVYEEEF